jgi:hypothetical protein
MVAQFTQQQEKNETYKNVKFDRRNIPYSFPLQVIGGYFSRPGERDFNGIPQFGIEMEKILKSFNNNMPDRYDMRGVFLSAMRAIIVFRSQWSITIQAKIRLSVCYRHSDY